MVKLRDGCGGDVIMHALKLDYLTDGRNLWLGLAVLLAGLCGTLIMLWSYHEGSQKIARQELVIAGIRSENAAKLELIPVEADSEKITLETNQAKVIILALNLPWKELFAAVETYTKDDVAVLSIEPDSQKGFVRINAEAKSLDSMLAYLAYLQKTPLFREVELVNHQIQEQDPQQPVRFMLQASWGGHP
jgi:Tfp pilus assembly protein PilN